MIRPAGPGDWSAIVEIQRASPEASQWDPAGYDVRVAESGEGVVGFLVTRAVADDEIEILNLAVRAEFRRRGYARALLEDLLGGLRGAAFLEVRESNTAARKLYQSLGFNEVSRRPEYYWNPREASIVMKFHSC